MQHLTISISTSGEWLRIKQSSEYPEKYSIQGTNKAKRVKSVNSSISVMGFGLNRFNCVLI